MMVSLRAFYLAANPPAIGVPTPAIFGWAGIPHLPALAHCPLSRNRHTIARAIAKKLDKPDTKLSRQGSIIRLGDKPSASSEEH
jgi:hypothetical protein